MQTFDGFHPAHGDARTRRRPRSRGRIRTGRHLADPSPTGRSSGSGRRPDPDERMSTGINPSRLTFPPAPEPAVATEAQTTSFTAARPRRIFTAFPSSGVHPNGLRSHLRASAAYGSPIRFAIPFPIRIFSSMAARCGEFSPVPSPLYSGERGWVRGNVSSCAARK